MTNLPMTNNRNIVMLKCADLAMLVAGAVALLFLVILPDPLAGQLPPIWLTFGVLGLFAVSYWLMNKALKKHMSGDAFSSWRTITGRGFCLAAIVGVVISGWDSFVSIWQIFVPMMVIVFAVSWGVPALMKKRMEADAFAKFDRKYQWASFAVLAAVLFVFVKYIIPLWISK
ncbi:MAG: hypothetical protein ACR2P4_07675 [Gammaproteobacteria bacterium]